MDMFVEILKLATIFEQASLKKEASAISDLAIRIMHSLVPYASEHPDQAKSTMMHLTNKHLIGVAERYVQRAAGIIKDELQWSRDTSALQRANLALKNKNYSSVIKIGLSDFAKEQNWDVGYGGQKWLQYCQLLIKLIDSINEFKKAKALDNIKKMEETSGEITIYMNVLDGLTHNTGSFISKIIAEESPFTEDNPDEFRNEVRKTMQLMNVKQLSHKEDVLPFIKQYIMQNPDAYLYKEFYSRLLKESKPDLERSKKELEEIDNRKKLIDFIINNYDYMIRIIEEELKNKNASNLINRFELVKAIPDDWRWKQIKPDLTRIANQYLQMKTKPNYAIQLQKYLSK
jgi:hypothetical protein